MFAENGQKFAWTFPERVGWYPPEEGNRLKPLSDKIWSQLEIFSMDRLKEIQWKRFKFLLQWAWDRTEFYRRKYSEAGISPDDIKTMDDIRKLPLTKKEDFEKSQREKPLFGDFLAYPENAPVWCKFWTTSGTTGPPRLWMGTQEDTEVEIVHTLKMWYAMGIKPGMRAYMAFGYPPFIAMWAMHAALEMLGCPVIPKGSIPTEIMLKNLIRWKAHVMVSTPTYAIRQLEVAKKLNIDPCEIGIQKIVLGGEPGGCVPRIRKILQEGWGAEVYDGVGSTETGGPTLYLCQAQAKKEIPSVHLESGNFLWEIVDPETYEPVGVNQRGVSVITPLMRFGMPVIRFLMNDIIEVTDEACECGRTFPLAKGGILGRADDVLFIKGVKIYPMTFEYAIASIPELGSEYQVILMGNEIKVMVEPKPEVDKSLFVRLAEKLNLELKSLTTLTIPVEIAELGSLPRVETKSQRIVKKRSI